MRLAILADIHGNLPAFEAALKHAAQHKADQLIIAGDIVNGAPDSKGCLDLARSLGCPILRGNHERYVADYGTPKGSPRWETEQFAPVQWSVAQFSAAERQWLAELPTCLRLPEAPDLFFTHASERDDHDTIKPYTPERTLHEMFPTAQARYIVRAHNHESLVRVWDRGYIITSGSVGLPLDGSPTAQYLLLDQTPTGWAIQHQSVPYDIQATIRRFYETNYLATVGPMGRLFFREVVTASHQITPFLRFYAQCAEKNPLSLAHAVDRFLNF